MVEQAFASELGDSCGQCGGRIAPFAEMVVISSGTRQSSQFGVCSWRKVRCKACADKDGYQAKPITVVEAATDADGKPQWGSVAEMVEYFRGRFSK